MICSRWENCYMECLKDARQSKCDNKNLQNCIVSNDCRDRITCRDSGKSYTLINTRKVKAVHYKVDGGVVVEDKSVPSDTRKCDDAIFSKPITDIKRFFLHFRKSMPDVQPAEMFQT